MRNLYCVSRWPSNTYDELVDEQTRDAATQEREVPGEEEDAREIYRYNRVTVPL